MNIGDAIVAIRNGKKATRANWNGKGQYIFLAHDIQYIPQGDTAMADAVPHNTMGNAAIVFHGTIGEQVGWLASQADLLSEDWVILDG